MTPDTDAWFGGMGVLVAVGVPVGVPVGVLVAGNGVSVGVGVIVGVRDFNCTAYGQAWWWM
jgi:hypothetical protein